MPLRTGFTVQQKLEALAQLATREQRGESAEQLAARVGVSQASLYYWKSQHEKGQLVEGAVTGTSKHTLEFKRQIVQLHVSGTKGATAICAENGINQSALYRWASAYKDGRLGPKFPKSQSPQTTALAAPQPPAPTQHVLQFVETPPPSARHSNGHVQLGRASSYQEELARLRDENARLKAKLRKALNMVIDDE